MAPTGCAGRAATARGPLADDGDVRVLMLVSVATGEAAVALLAGPPRERLVVHDVRRPVGGGGDLVVVAEEGATAGERRIAHIGGDLVDLQRCAPRAADVARLLVVGVDVRAEPSGRAAGRRVPCLVALAVADVDDAVLADVDHRVPVVG